MGLPVFFALFYLAEGCSSKPKTTAEGKPVSGTDEQIFLGDTIEKNYDPNVIMKRGEAFFDKEEFAEAIVEYQHFLELHRAHQLAVYAQFRSLSRRPLRLSKNCGRISQGANMKPKPFSGLKTATTGWPRPTSLSDNFITDGLPISRRHIALIKS
jgi:hypothetical protein